MLRPRLDPGHRHRAPPSLPPVASLTCITPGGGWSMVSATPSPTFQGCGATASLTEILRGSWLVAAQMCRPSSHEEERPPPCSRGHGGPMRGGSPGSCPGSLRPATPLGQAVSELFLWPQAESSSASGQRPPSPRTHTSVYTNRSTLQSREGGTRRVPASSGRPRPPWSHRPEGLGAQVVGSSGAPPGQRGGGPAAVQLHGARTSWAGGFPGAGRATKGWACPDDSLRCDSLGTSS